MTEHYLGDDVYADIVDDGAIAIRTSAFREIIYLERDTQIALAGLIERRRREDADTALDAGRAEHLRQRIANAIKNLSQDDAIRQMFETEI